MNRRHRRIATTVAGASIMAMALAACGGAGGSTGADGGDQEVNVLMVNNPQMVDLQKLTADAFTADTGIKVNYTVLPENDVRAKISQEFSSQAGQYDVASISNYEVPFYATNGWLTPLDDTVAASAEFDQGDILEPMTKSLTAADGKLYAEPFYGESSFLMYRKDVFDAAGLTMPDKPTWDQVAELAAEVDGAEDGMKGICLRGQPGWGQVYAPLTSVVNTFGGTWFDEDWTAQADSPEFTEAVQFYVDLVREHGENGAAQAGYTECLNNLQQGNVAMWYDSTAAAGSLEADDSPVKGKLGYVAAPVKETASSGWLYSWAWGIQKAGKNQDAAAEFIAWASSKEYEQLVGEKIGWSSVPAGKRASTYDNADYQASAGAFYQQTEDAITTADPDDPGVQPRPAPGIQFVAIPEFADMATQASQEISAAIAGQTSVTDAVAEGQQLAEKVAEKYQE
ncbi:sugar ABC transporter substrate-binding protein [Frigoribacterium sp. CFBP 13707]|uniref:ABC transporter substrate-binding protein n=1 Tax=Frigoribacterium sp. CFBP 13707 TaxID=2775313 RepID=UPI00177D09C5|nr:sugar ABC transporter substrate-binding protein [Frigoribacterium sp. CFBP 13707]MBD8728126.1 sugar ABC transporter substrate-binding protein [Frigoribacterium sp. CFBP 13707]